MALFSSTAARAESFGPPSAQPASQPQENNNRLGKRRNETTRQIIIILKCIIPKMLINYVAPFNIRSVWLFCSVRYMMRAGEWEEEIGIYTTFIHTYIRRYLLRLALNWSALQSRSTRSLKTDKCTVSYLLLPSLSISYKHSRDRQRISRA